MEQIPQHPMMSKAPDNPPDSKSSAPDSKESLLVQSLLIEIAGMALELAAAIFSNSLSLYADIVKEFVETLTTLTSWLTMRQVRKYRHEFEFGFGKVESLLSVLMAAGLLYAGVDVLRTAWARFLDPQPLEKVGFGVVLNILWIGLDGYFWHKLRRESRDRPSPVISAKAKSFLASCLVCAALAATLGIGKLYEHHAWALYIDPVVSVGFSVYLFWAGVSIVRGAFSDLSDRTLEESLQLVIMRELARHFDDYKQLHGIRSRRTGGLVKIELYLEFSPEQRMESVYKIAESLSADLESKIRHSRVTVIPTRKGPEKSNMPRYSTPSTPS